ncbi:hypothetical protein SLA2020_400740 [Shorea laevis]
MSKWLPNEVVINILSRLPMKSLIFKCVSKAWCSLISNPHFIATHLNHSLSNSPHSPYLLVRHYDNKPNIYYAVNTFLLYLDQEIEQKGDFFASPSYCLELHSYGNVLNLVGSSNNLLCLVNVMFDNKRGSCVVWNPSIQKPYPFRSLILTFR